MAKMFYSLEEAAQKLGVSEDDIREMAASGQLQQFRDRDKLMFKREQIDDLADGDDAPPDDSDDQRLDESIFDEQPDGTIPLAEDDPPVTEPSDRGTSDTDVIDLITSSQLDTLDISMPEISTGQTPELDEADRTDEPQSDETTQMASEPTETEQDVDLAGATQITEPSLDLDEDEDLVLEQVGSGSGLLDLTRESDDTSLGAELLDEIYPASESSDDKLGETDATGSFDTMDTIDSPITSSSMFDGSVELDISTSGLENLQDTGEPSSVVPSSITVPAAERQEVQVVDYAGNGLGIGMLLVSLFSLFLVLIVVTYALMGVPSTTTAWLARYPVAYSGGLLALGIGLGLVGMFFGKVQKR